MIVRIALFISLLFCYGMLFSQQESRLPERSLQLSHPLPQTVQRVALGYLRQLGGEILFIKAAVFIGGVEPGRDPLSYAEPLSQLFSTAAALHPDFVDTYYLCQSSLPYISSDYARRANEVLAHGMIALPDNLMPPFFTGFNYMYHLNEPLEAARIFSEAATRPGGEMFTHMVNILSAEGGDIIAALMGLKAMRASEQSEFRQKRLDEEIAAFEKAVSVLNSIKRYEKTTGTPPHKLSDLVPNYMASLPDLEPLFFLEWQAPHLSVVSAARKKQKKQ